MPCIQRFVIIFYGLILLLNNLVLATDIIAPSPDAIPSPCEWNFMTYMANNNNLYRYGMANFRQMVQAGSNKNMNLLLQMDSLGQKEISRFFIDQNNAKLIESVTNTATSFSGTPINLYEFAGWGTTSFPAQKTCLVLWNHGAGIKDPNIWGRMLMRWRDDLFVLNKKTGLLELDRTLNTRTAQKELFKKRGIAFNEAAEAYLTNDDLKNSLEAICQDFLGGQKIPVLAMDACHMAMAEVGSQVKNSVSIMVASEEVEPGTGWDYKLALAAFDQPATEKAVASSFVSAYATQYSAANGDYTQSAIDLSFCGALEANVSRLANALIELIDSNGQPGFKIIRDLRFSRSATTEFFDTDYIDLGHLYKSLLSRAQNVIDGKFSFFSTPLPQPEIAVIVCKEIGNACAEGLMILQDMVIANAAGKNLKEASGLSIYFPASSIHPSYAKTVFAQNTTWPAFLDKFIKTRFKKVQSAKKLKKRSTSGSCRLQK
jgi:hypothetical protein